MAGARRVSRETGIADRDADGLALYRIWLVGPAV
jgi:hypothetical protein